MQMNGGGMTEIKSTGLQVQNIAKINVLMYLSVDEV